MGAIVGIIANTEPEYSAERSVVLVRTGVTELSIDEGDESQVVETARNPYDAFSFSAEATTEVMADLAVSRDFRRAVGSEGVPNDHTVRIDDNAPILAIETTGETPDQALRAALVVVELLRDDLEARQSAFEIPLGRQIVADDVVVPETAGEVNANRDRALIGAIIVGLVLVVISAIAADLLIPRLQHRRAERRRAAEEAAAEEVAAEEAAADDRDQDVEHAPVADEDGRAHVGVPTGHHESMQVAHGPVDGAAEEPADTR